MATTLVDITVSGFCGVKETVYIMFIDSVDNDRLYYRAYNYN